VPSWADPNRVAASAAPIPSDDPTTDRRVCLLLIVLSFPTGTVFAPVPNPDEINRDKTIRSSGLCQWCGSGRAQCLRSGAGRRRRR
jgi:hypothetical protein